MMFTDTTGFKQTILLFVILFLSTFAGCTPTTKQYVPLPNELSDVSATRVRMYVYRTEPWDGLVGAAEISDGDELIGQVTVDGYICWERAPGTTILRANIRSAKGAAGDLKSEIPVDTTGGKTYFIQIDTNSPLSPLTVGAIGLLGQMANGMTMKIVPPKAEKGSGVPKECNPPAVSVRAAK